MITATLETLRAIIVRTVSIGQRQRAASADPDMEIEDLGVDALDRVTIACAVDEEWNIEVSDRELESWLTVGDIIRTIEHRA